MRVTVGRPKECAVVDERFIDRVEKPIWVTSVVADVLGECPRLNREKTPSMCCRAQVTRIQHSYNA